MRPIRMFGQMSLLLRMRRPLIPARAPEPNRNWLDETCTAHARELAGVLGDTPELFHPFQHVLGATPELFHAFHYALGATPE